MTRTENTQTHGRGDTTHDIILDSGASHPVSMSHNNVSNLSDIIDVAVGTAVNGKTPALPPQAHGTWNLPIELQKDDGEDQP